MRIALCGKKGSGKTKMASFFEERSYVKVSFADPLKEMLSKATGELLEKFYKPELKELESITLKPDFADRMAAEILSRSGHHPQDVFLPLQLLMWEAKQISPRSLMQIVGTDILRKHIPLIHVELTRNTIESIHKAKGIVCDDARFPNELAMLKEQGFSSIYLIRPDNPFDTLDGHASENSMSSHDCDEAVLSLEGDYLEHLAHKIVRLGSIPDEAKVATYDKDYAYTKTKSVRNDGSRVLFVPKV